MKIYEIKERPKVYPYNGIKNKSKVIDYLCRKDEELVSNCCSAPAYPETDICSHCKEHCEVVKTE